MRKGLFASTDDNSSQMTKTQTTPLSMACCLDYSNREKEHLPLMEEAEVTTEPRHRDHHRYCHRRSASHYEKTPTFVVQVRGGLIDSEVSTSRWDVENEETQGTVRRPLRLQRLNADTGRGLFSDGHGSLNGAT